MIHLFASETTKPSKSSHRCRRAPREPPYERSARGLSSSSHDEQERPPAVHAPLFQNKEEVFKHRSDHDGDGVGGGLSAPPRLQLLANAPGAGAETRHVTSGIDGRAVGAIADFRQARRDTSTRVLVSGLGTSIKGPGPRAGERSLARGANDANKLRLTRVRGTFFLGWYGPDA